MKKLRQLLGGVGSSAIYRLAMRYKLLSLALLAAAAAAILQLCKLSGDAHWVLSLAALLAAIPLLAGMWRDWHAGSYGIDVLAVTAIISAVACKQYWTALVVVLVLCAAEILKDYAARRSRRQLESLRRQTPAIAHVLRGRRLVDAAPDQLQPGDRIVVKSGEIVPADAVITDSAANFAVPGLAALAAPASLTPGMEVLSGSLNLGGDAPARVARVAASSYHQRLSALLSSAQASPSPFGRLTGRFVWPFTAAAFILAIAAWYLSGQSIRFLDVMVVATPAPLLVAAPVAFLGGLSQAARHSILVLSNAALERLAKTHTLAFAKSGVLTGRYPELAEITAFKPFTRQQVLGLAAAAETGIQHPLAESIVRAAAEQGVKVPKARHVQEFSSRGAVATAAGNAVVIGQLSLLRDNGVVLPPDFPRQLKPANLARPAAYIAVGGQLAGVITFRSELRPESRATLDRLRKLGIKQFEMVTGDGHGAAAAVASQLGITQVTAEASPSAKLLALEGIKQRPVAFVGNGVYDAHVLTGADTGIALHSPEHGLTAVAESADIVLLPDGLGSLADATAIARRTYGVARQSLLLGVLLSVALMTIAATGHIRPLYGALLQGLLDVLVILSALRAHSS